jgi:membrane-associated protease RseP (regulator of RpoE activity)
MKTSVTWGFFATPFSAGEFFQFVPGDKFLGIINKPVQKPLGHLLCQGIKTPQKLVSIQGSDLNLLRLYR